MKRIIDGVTYNTLTATTVGRYEYENEKGYEVSATVYATRGAALFIVHAWNTDEGDAKYHFEAITRDALTRAIQTIDNFEIVDETLLEAPPEAEAEVEQSATIYLRVPASLKRRIDEASQAGGVSTNAWAMRCVERCLATGADPQGFSYGDKIIIERADRGWTVQAIFARSERAPQGSVWAPGLGQKPTFPDAVASVYRYQG